MLNEPVFKDRLVRFTACRFFPEFIFVFSEQTLKRANNLLLF